MYYLSISHNMMGAYTATKDMKPKVSFSPSCIIRLPTGVTLTTNGYSLLQILIATP